ncbi:hypothetical protein ANO11243_009910 [Dothideomycetidae sp. 11243]|nr:hypothetical protein ANO11243_009910 [fungal sp. No.11243]
MRLPHIAIRPQTDVRSLSGIVTTEECQWLLYFSQKTSKAMSYLADSDFWTNLVPQLGCADPAIRHALLAVGSCYKRLEAASRPGRMAETATVAFTLKHYNIAIALLSNRVNEGHATLEASLVCCLLFIGLESMLINRDLMMQHLNNGISILNSLQLENSGTDSVIALDARLGSILRRIDAQSTLFGNPVSTRIVDSDQVDPLGFPISFANFDQAGATFNRLATASLNFVKSVYESTFATFMPGCSPHAMQRRLQERLWAFKSALDDLEHGSAPNTSSSRLRLQYCATFVYLSACLESSEYCFGSYMNEFTTIVRLARSLPAVITRETGPESPVFSLYTYSG